MFRKLLLKLKLVEHTLEELVAKNQELGRLADKINQERLSLKAKIAVKLKEKHG